jgi:hypothetical protein
MLTLASPLSYYRLVFELSDAAGQYPISSSPSCERGKHAVTLESRAPVARAGSERLEVSARKWADHGQVNLLQSQPPGLHCRRPVVVHAGLDLVNPGGECQRRPNAGSAETISTAAEVEKGIF